MQVERNKKEQDNSNTPWKINMEHLHITHLERNMTFQSSMIMFHVDLQGCKSNWIISGGDF